MNDLKKQVYTDMSTTDRILLWMIKVSELRELGDLMIELGDMPVLKKALDIIQENAKEGKDA